MLRDRFALWLLTTVAVAWFGSVSAQTPQRGSVAGRVTDPSGGPLQGALVTLTGSGITQSMVADGDVSASFVFDGLDASDDVRYSIKVEVPGFVTVVRQGFSVPAGGTAFVDVRLKLGCLENAHVAMYDPHSELQVSHLVAHVRITADSERRLYDLSDTCRTATFTTARIIDVAKATNREWRVGQTIELLSGNGTPFRAGADYLAFLLYNERLGRLVIDESYFREVVRGRVRWFRDEELGFRDGASIGRAMSRLRAEVRRPPRYLNSLRYQTGWLLIGTLASYRDTWWPDGQPFEFLEDDPTRWREVPQAGDRIRLRIQGRVYILDYATRGEARRLTAPIRERLYERSAETGRVVAVGDTYRVGDVRIDQRGDDRFVWVRLIAE